MTSLHLPLPLALLTSLVGLTTEARTQAYIPPPAGHTSDGDTEQSYLKSYDLGGLSRGAGEADDVILDDENLRLLRGQYTFPDLDLELEGEATFALTLLDLLDEELSYPGRSATLGSDQTLLLYGPESLHARFRSLLEFFENTIQAEVRIGVSVLTFEPGSEPGHSTLLEPTDAGALAASAEHVESFQVSVHSGRLARFGSSFTRSALMDFDVEIAQGSAILDPQVYSIPTGIEGLVIGAPGEGGTHLTMVMGVTAQSDLPDIPVNYSYFAGSEESGGTTISALKSLPRVEVQGSRSAFSTFLPDDKVLALASSHDTDMGEMSRVVLVRKIAGGLPVRSELEIDEESRRIFVWDSSAQTPPRVTCTGQMFSNVLGSWLFTGWPPFDDSVAQISILRSTQLDWMYDVSGVATVDQFNSLYILAEEEPNSGDQGAIQTMTSGADSPELFEVMFTAKDGNESRVVSRHPICMGSAMCAVVGSQRTSVVDYDVEVAQFAAIADPIVKDSLNGMIVWVRPNLMSDGRLSIDVRGGTRISSDEQPVEIGSALLGPVQETSGRESTVSQRLVLEGTDGIWSADLGAMTGEDSVGLSMTIRRL